MQGIGEAGCTPVASAIIADYFQPANRGAAMGVYNWGIYMGYSIAYGPGNAIASAHGYRSIFYIFGLAGIPLALLILFTVKEPARGSRDAASTDRARQFTLKEASAVFFSRRSILLLCLAGAVRNSAGYVWGYNVNNFFENVRNLHKEDIAKYMSWVSALSVISCAPARLTRNAAPLALGRRFLL
jgi:MFS family permease